MKKFLLIICLLAIPAILISADVINPAPTKAENNIAPAVVKAVKKAKAKTYKKNCRYSTYSSCKYRSAWKSTCKKYKASSEESNLVTP